MEVLLTVLLFLWQIGWVALLGGGLCAVALWLIPALRKRKKSAFAACVLAVLLLLAGLCLRPIVIGGSGAQREQARQLAAGPYTRQTFTSAERHV